MRRTSGKVMMAAMFSFAVLGMVFFAFAYPTLKVSGQGLVPFGGQIMFVEYCCNGVAITVGTPNPARVLITLGSIIYPNYNVYMPGPQVLGTYIPATAACMEVVSFCFISVPVWGIVTQIGTSGF